MLSIAMVFLLLLIFYSLRIKIYKLSYDCYTCLGPVYLPEMTLDRTMYHFLHGPGVYMTFMINFALPVCLLFILNGFMILTLKDALLKRRKITNRQVDDETKMLLVTCIVYVVLVMPDFIEYFPGVLSLETRDMILILRPLNCSVNFIIYAIVGKSFRNKVKKLFSPCDRCRCV